MQAWTHSITAVMATVNQVAVLGN